MWLFDVLNLSKIKFENEQLKLQNSNLELEKQKLNGKLDELGYPDIKIAQELLSDVQKQYELESSKLSNINDELIQKNNEFEKVNKQIKTNTNKLTKIKDCAKRVNYALDNYINSNSTISINQEDIEFMEDISPSVILKLHCMDVKDLRKAYRANDKQINELLSKYSNRYTTKANKAIYSLMVIALRAELQNILYNLKYEKLDKSIDDVKSVTQKYLQIASDGNQSIAGTLTKFIGEIEYLFINAVKIEYNYYVKKEQAKQEQLAIKEQMRQEAEERKALEAEKKKIAQEESKYNSQIEKIKEQLASANESEIEKLNSRILELQSQLSDVIIKKKEISKLANGKAGNVYVISNLGSFGENVFKIGMTRRLNPQDRVNELGDASVPFKFDVHSFIFSDDAVGLENKLHTILNKKRVNKVNLRKEFFYCTINELEQLVTEIEPTAEFNKTMLAEEFRQSQSSDEIYTSDEAIHLEEFDDE